MQAETYYKRFLIFFSLSGIGVLIIIGNQTFINNDNYVKNFLTESWPIHLPSTYGKNLLLFNNTSSLPEGERLFMEVYTPVMWSRLRRIGEVCSRYPELNGNPSFNNLVWIDRGNSTPVIAWCCNFKVGAGTWTVNFLKVAHFNENNPAVLALPEAKRKQERFKHKYWETFSILQDVFPQPRNDEEKIQKFKEAIRFTAVRHPFTRLLSGYRNIIERSVPKLKHEPKFKALRKEIIDKYRPTNSSNAGVFPTFSEFIQYLIEVVNSTGLFQWSQEINGYWDPFWSSCRICESDYTVVVKLETLEEDERFLAILGDLKEIKNEKPEWIHKIGGKSSFDIAHNYYRQLTQKQMVALHQIYKYDFELFDYDFEQYIRLPLLR